MAVTDDINYSNSILCFVLPILYFLEYVSELMDFLFNDVILDPAPFVAEMKAVPVPGFLCEQYERPEKADAVANHVSRFSCPGTLQK